MRLIALLVVLGTTGAAADPERVAALRLGPSFDFRGINGGTTAIAVTFPLKHGFSLGGLGSATLKEPYFWSSSTLRFQFERGPVPLTFAAGLEGRWSGPSDARVTPWVALRVLGALIPRYDFFTARHDAVSYAHVLAPTVGAAVGLNLHLSQRWDLEVSGELRACDYLVYDNDIEPSPICQASAAVVVGPALRF